MKKNNKIKAVSLLVAVCLFLPEIFPSVIRAEVTDRNRVYSAEGKVMSPRSMEKKVSGGPKKEVYEDFATKVVGSDGKRYENVEYLSSGALSRLNEQMRRTYYDACDEIADDIKNGIDEEAVIAVSEDGKLTVSVNIDMTEVFSEDIQEQFMDGSPEPDSGAQNAPVSQEKTEQETVNSADLEIVSENMQLLEENSIEEEDALEIPAKAFDLIPSDKNYFRKQLDSASKSVYDAVVSSASGGSNKTEINGSVSSVTACSAVSAAMNTYIKAFEWTSGSGTLNRSFIADPYGDITTTITISSSDHYSAKLEKSAQAKVSELASAAKSYAENYYPNDISYGIIRYINDWICDNNYYNENGTSTNDRSTELYFNCHSSYGVLLKGYGVCESYAKSVSRILDEVGIRSLYVVGYAGGGGHAWNYVYLNDSWYLLDSTWNDTSSSDKYFLAGAYQNSGRSADGTHYANSINFSFPDIAAADYSENTEPVPTPTVVPVVTPTVIPVVTPTAVPSVTPTVIPVVTPTAAPVVTPTAMPSVTPTPTVIPVPTYIPDPSGLTEDSFEFELSEMALNAGEKAYAKIKAYDDRVSSYDMIWESDDTSVAKVNSRGRIKAVKNGEAQISVTIDGITKSLDVYVCKSTLKFENGRSKLRKIYRKYDGGDFNENDRLEIPIYVKTSKNMLDAGELLDAGRLPEISCSNRYADAEITEVMDDRLILTVSPKAAGIATKIVVRFNGGKAVYIVTSRYSY